MRGKALIGLAPSGVRALTLATAGVGVPELHIPGLDSLTNDQLRAMRIAAKEVLECRRVLRGGGLNVVGEVLRGQGEFVELEHYPSDDVFDHHSHSQYYYHAHRGAVEHGHFHCFLRAAGFPPNAEAIDWPIAQAAWPTDDDAICHLVAISMDAWGEPVGLFACNRWVTDESWYSANAVIQMLQQFEIDHAAPSWPVNRWLSAMLRLYQPWIACLLRHRDEVIAHRQQSRPEQDTLEDRTLEITGHVQIDVDTLASSLGAT